MLTLTGAVESEASVDAGRGTTPVPVLARSVVKPVKFKLRLEESLPAGVVRGSGATMVASEFELEADPDAAAVSLAVALSLAAAGALVAKTLVDNAVRSDVKAIGTVKAALEPAAPE